MADLFRTGAAWLNEKLKAHASRTVEYRRGETTVELLVTVGSSLLKLGDELGGGRLERTHRDYLFAAADLVAGGISLPPKAGDSIADAVTGTTEIYELRPYGNDEPLWRPSDPQGIRLRVHTKRMGTE